MAVKIKQPIRTIAPKSSAKPGTGPAPTEPEPRKRIAGGPVKPNPAAPPAPPVEDDPAEESAPPSNGEVNAQQPTTVIDIPIEDIQVIPDPHRTESEDAERNSIFDMARSFQDLGILHPIVVNATDSGGYDLVAGRKRIKAATLLKWETIPAVVKNYDVVKTKMAIITENIVRTAYSRAEYDKAIAEWGLMYESLHPETKKQVAGGKSRGADKTADAAKASGKKVSSKPPTKSFTKTVSEQTGLKRRTVEQARKRGTTFTSDDYAVFKSRGIKVHDQDSISAITDPKKRAEVIALINTGVSFRKAWDSVMLPPGSVSSAEASDEAGKPQTDEEWLAQCPIRGKVVTKLFDAQALFYRRLVDLKARLERGFNQARKEFKGLTGGSKGYPASVNRFIKTKHPKEWVVCGTCAGTGAKEKSPCSDCDAGGFKIS